jgi:hypothetical protein
MSMPSIELYLRHIREGGAKIAEFLVAHPEIDPHFIEDMTKQQQAELRRHISDLTTTHEIERHELNLLAHNQPNISK